MTFEEIMQQEREDKRIVDGLGVPYLKNEDIEVCNYVSEQLSSITISKNSINFGRNMSLEELLTNSVLELSIFGDDFIHRILRILKSVNIHNTDDTLGFGTFVRYEWDESGLQIPLNGVISGFVIPNDLYEISLMFASHEYMHALKDTIYYEYILNKTIGETIPMFYELISCEDNVDLKKEMIKTRLYFILDNRQEYLLFNDMIRQKASEYIFSDNINLREEVDLYRFIRSKIGCYLNSFYYALILYNLYKKNPSRVLELIIKVLRHEITTLDMLEYLGIYGDIHGQVFEKELGNIKKLIK